MKKNLVVLVAGLLAMGFVFAAESNYSPVKEAVVSSQKQDLAALDYGKTELNALPQAVQQAVVKLQEAGATLREALVGKTAEGKSVFKLMLEGDKGMSTVYLDESGNVLQTDEVKKVEEVEEEVEEVK